MNDDGTSEETRVNDHEFDIFMVGAIFGMSVAVLAASMLGRFS